MTRARIVVDPAFLVNHYNNPIKHSSDDLLSNPTKDTWRQINHLLTNWTCNEVYLFSPESIEKNIDNDLLFALVNAIYGRTTDNVNQIKNEKEAFESEQIKLSNYYFLDNEKKESASIDESLKYTSKNVLSRWIFKYNEEGQLNINVSWDYFLSKKHFTRYIIIEDAYIFAAAENIKNNFIPLLKKLFSYGTQKCQLLIITNKLFLQDQNLVESVHRHILEKISKDDDLKDKIELSIAKVPEANMVHSRLIFSDYFRIRFDNSINFFDRNGKYRLNTFTPVSFYSHTSQDNFNYSKELINQTKIKLSLNQTILIGNFDMNYFDLW